MYLTSTDNHIASSCFARNMNLEHEFCNADCKTILSNTTNDNSRYKQLVCRSFLIEINSLVISIDHP